MVQECWQREGKNVKHWKDRNLHTDNFYTDNSWFEDGWSFDRGSLDLGAMSGRNGLNG